MCKYCEDYITNEDYQPFMKHEISTVFGDTYFELNIARDLKNNNRPVIDFIIGNPNDNNVVKSVPIGFCPICGENLKKLHSEHKLQFP